MISNKANTSRFRLGQVVATPSALSALRASGQTPATFVTRHVTGDWGNLGADDIAANESAIAHEGDDERQARVLSSYLTSLGEKLWVITEADRTSTCLLLPEDY